MIFNFFELYCSKHTILESDSFLYAFNKVPELHTNEPRSRMNVNIFVLTGEIYNRYCWNYFAAIWNALEIVNFFGN